jgi:hypothetical protein
MEDEEIRYELRTHSIHQDQQVVDILFSGEVIASFYSNSRNGKRVLMVLSKYLKRVDLKENEDTESRGIMIELGRSNAEIMKA